MEKKMRKSDKKYHPEEKGTVPHGKSRKNKKKTG